MAFDYAGIYENNVEAARLACRMCNAINHLAEKSSERNGSADEVLMECASYLGNGWSEDSSAPWETDRAPGQYGIGGDFYDRCPKEGRCPVAKVHKYNEDLIAWARSIEKHAN